MGWLHARPKRNGKEGRPRIQARRDAGAPLNLPQITARRDLLDAMMAEDGIGWCQIDGMGERRPLPWAEIVAFGAHQGLDEWERGTIRALSLAYLDGLEIGADPAGVAPCAGADPAADRRALAAGIRGALRAARS